jgi:hypothetical protein
MKKSIIFSLFILAGAFMACEPIVNSDEIGGAITSADLNVKATPIVVNGKNGNMVVLENHSPVLSSWNCGGTTSIKAYDTVMVVKTGVVDVAFTGLNPDGTKIEKKFTIQIDALTTLPTEYKYLFGDPTQGVTSKKYVWDETAGAVWGNGGYLGNTSPGWWTNDKASMTTNDPDYGSDGYMVFSLTGLTLKKSNAAGTKSETGTADLDLSAITKDGNGAVWASAKLNTKNVTVLCGKQPNSASKQDPIYSYDILKLNGSKLVLAWPEPGAGAWGTAWFWMFRIADK